MNSDNHLLAIIIPAYKKTFFQEALQSIASQTDQRFTVYIGDDHSPQELHRVVQEFENRMNIIYHRFAQNMGGTDLVVHWHRCIALSRGEPWIWLFSDDDVMDENCVASFYAALEAHRGEDLFHFNVNIINESSEETGKFQPFPVRLSSADFFYSRITYALSSFVVEYIFSRQIYENEGRFEKFDLAWCSDDATWIKFAGRRGIFTIEGAKVKWRFSQINISSQVEDRRVILRKLAASEAYLLWADRYFFSKSIKDKTSSFQKLKWMLHQFHDTSALSYREKLRSVDQVVTNLGYLNIRLKAKLYVAYMTLKNKKKHLRSIGR